MSAAARIFEVVDRKPDIDSSRDEGEKLEHTQGAIEFVDVDFR
jgi:ABC-type multidrug transport system fused ATPase/permease subunit